LHDNFGKIPGFQVSKRAVFIIDEKGVIRYSWIRRILARNRITGKLRRNWRSYDFR